VREIWGQKAIKITHFVAPTSKLGYEFNVNHQYVMGLPYGDYKDTREGCYLGVMKF
jgi:hypothetical protein